MVVNAHYSIFLLLYCIFINLHGAVNNNQLQDNFSHERLKNISKSGGINNESGITTTVLKAFYADSNKAFNSNPHQQSTTSHLKSTNHKGKRAFNKLKWRQQQQLKSLIQHVRRLQTKLDRFYDSQVHFGQRYDSQQIKHIEAKNKHLKREFNGAISTLLQTLNKFDVNKQNIKPASRLPSIITAKKRGHHHTRKLKLKENPDDSTRSSINGSNVASISASSIPKNPAGGTKAKREKRRNDKKIWNNGRQTFKKLNFDVKGEPGYQCKAHKDCKPGLCCHLHSIPNLGQNVSKCYEYRLDKAQPCTNSCQCVFGLNCYRSYNETLILRDSKQKMSKEDVESSSKPGFRISNNNNNNNPSGRCKTPEAHDVLFGEYFNSDSTNFYSVETTTF